MKHYNYIISGAGAAGFSLLMRFMTYAAFSNKSILVVDKAPKTENDHTWCFWETEPGLFEPVVHHNWQQVHFYSSYYSSLLHLHPYLYKMIRSIDLYNYVYEEAGKHLNIDFAYGNVEAVGNTGNKGFIVLNGERLTADYIFNSISFTRPLMPAGKHHLLQHFKGFVIETSEAIFDPAVATLMDFRVSQQQGTTFVYVLPLAKNKALVEYTLFTADLLKEEEYSAALHHYISTYLNVKAYSVKEEEFGIIPMTNFRFEKRRGNVINLGTVGGQTKASSGYTFQFIQKHSNQIIKDLLQYGSIKNRGSFLDRRFNFYDSTLLNILSANKLAGDQIFSDLFSKNPVDRVLRFLDNESTLGDEINLVATLPKKVFVKAALQEIFNH